MINNYTPGQGCECHAHSEAECGCDVDWTPSEVYELRQQRDRLAGALFMCRRELVYVLDDINKERVSHDGDDFHEALRISKEALAAVKGGSDE
jgi:hypothetical protein